MKMKIDKATEVFTHDTCRDADVGCCPFFEETVSKRFTAILDNPPEGLDGEALRMWKNKMTYAFLMVINPRFNRKNFASIFRVAYGTSRNWKNDKKVTDAAVNIAVGFIDDYIAEVMRLVSLPQGEMCLAEFFGQRNDALHKLFAEAVFYKNDFLVQLLIKSMEQLGREQVAAQQNEADLLRLIVEGKGDEIAARKTTKEEVMQAIENSSLALGTFLASCAFFRIQCAFCGVNNPKIVEGYNKLDQLVWEIRFHALRFLIDGGKTEEALDAVEAIEQQVNQLLEDSLFLEKELLKTKGKSGKKQAVREEAAAIQERP